LVSPELIEEYASEKAEIVYVGKQCSKGIWTPQKDINNLMVQFAKQGKLVLRLKGGDASLFSNILDELQILKEHQISYEIIPGVSAAFGAAAYTGIPLTAREYSRGVRFLTLYDFKFVTSSMARLGNYRRHFGVLYERTKIGKYYSKINRIWN
jgi:siroheme synthase